MKKILTSIAIVLASFAFAQAHTPELTPEGSTDPSTLARRRDSGGRKLYPSVLQRSRFTLPTPSVPPAESFEIY